MTRAALAGAIAAIAAIAAVAVPAAAGTPPPVVPVALLKSRAAELFPGASTSYLAWTANSVAAPSHADVFVRPRGGGPKVRVNQPGTQGYHSAMQLGSDRIAYQQFVGGGRSDIYLFDAATDQRRKLPPAVNTPVWEYWPEISSNTVLFLRVGALGRSLLAYDRSMKRTFQIAAAPLSCVSCLRGDWVGTANDAVYTRCSETTGACNVFYATWDPNSGVVNRVEVPGPPSGPVGLSQFGGTLDEATGELYFVRSSTTCGRAAAVDRWNLSTPATLPTRLYFLPRGVDLNLVQLAPSATAPGDSDLLLSERTCVSGNADVYQIDSVNRIP
jgi:hypothetical protein